MNIFHHPLCNFTLHPPAGIKADDCVPLPCVKALEPLAGSDQTVAVIQSFWMPAPEELKALNEGHPIMLTIWGRTHPPVRVEVCATKE